MNLNFESLTNTSAPAAELANVTDVALPRVVVADTSNTGVETTPTTAQPHSHENINKVDATSLEGALVLSAFVIVAAGTTWLASRKRGIRS